MLSPFGTFLLVVAAFVGTVLFFVNPAIKMEKWMRGKKSSELKAEIDEKLENETGSVIIQGCGLLVFVLIGLLYSFIVEPFAVIYAMINKIGYPPIAYAMLVIVGLSWVKVARALFASNNKKSAPKGTVMTERGQKVEGTVIEVDEEIKLGNPFLNAVGRLFYFLPDLYLWYMFLVVIGVLK